MTPQVGVGWGWVFQVQSDLLLASSGNTALTAANLLFEMLCVLPKVKYL